MKKIKKVKVRVDYDWLYGYLKYGYREGILELCDEEYESFKEDPYQFLLETGMHYDLKLILDDFVLEDNGDFDVIYTEVEEDE